jgi:hypothetical protein
VPTPCVQHTIRLSPELFERAKAYAEQRGFTFNRAGRMSRSPDTNGAEEAQAAAHREPTQQGCAEACGG